MSCSPWLRVSLSIALALPAFAQSPKVGAAAPAIAAQSWLNWNGDAPSLESLQGQVVLLEFWGTWCGPCVRAMPGIQKLHDRYRDRGLTVLAISYEKPDAMRPFLQKNAYTMPVGSDPDKKTIQAYGVRRWPTTVVLDKEGNVAHVGSPYDAETAVEKALGLDAGPAALLSELCMADKSERRVVLERLVAKATSDFDLRGWAKSHLPAVQVADEDAEQPPVQTARLRAPAKTLHECVKAWANDSKRQQLLAQLGGGAPQEFDLAAFAREAFAKDFPFGAAELKKLLKGQQYAAVLEAIAQRDPAKKVVSAAARHKGLAGYCRTKLDATRAMAKKGVMAQRWVFPGALPRDEKTNSKFFSELSVSGMAMSEDRKKIVGLTLGGEMVKAEQIDTFVQTQLASMLLMKDLGAGKKPAIKNLTKQIAKQQKAIVRDLESRYGKPEPRR